MALEFRLLGPLEVLHDGRLLELGGPRQRALVAALILRANEVVSSDSLVERLWQDRSPPAAGKATLQIYVSRLRKQLGRDVLVTRAPGYALLVGSDQLDLHRFEELVALARTAGSKQAAALLREALSLWRGTPLADVAHESFARTEVARLQELQLAALEARIDADLELGDHAALVAELESLVKKHPYRERLRGQLMLALYRSDRQAQALAVYREGRRVLDEELGLEPSEELRTLERAILAHDTSLARGVPPNGFVTPRRSLLAVMPREAAGAERALALVRPLAAASTPREIVLARIVERDQLAAATHELREIRTRLAEDGLSARAAAFSSASPGEDLARLASRHDVDLLVLEAGPDALQGEMMAVLAHAPCDVALVVAGDALGEGPIVVPFGAAEHDWAALELGTWIAGSTGRPLRLIGAASDSRADSKDASRLLADASLIVQRLADVVAEPLLGSPGRKGVRALAEGAGLLVVGLSDRWRHEGLGRIRADLASMPVAPTVFVRRGIRPGGLAPAEARTRFTWSLTSVGSA